MQNGFNITTLSPNKGLGQDLKKLIMKSADPISGESRTLQATSFTRHQFPEGPHLVPVANPVRLSNHSLWGPEEVQL